MALNIIFCMTSESPLKDFAYVMDFRTLFKVLCLISVHGLLNFINFQIDFYLFSLILFMVLYPFCYSDKAHSLCLLYCLDFKAPHVLFFSASHIHPFSFAFFLPYLISGSFQISFFLCNSNHSLSSCHIYFMKAQISWFYIPAREPPSPSPCLLEQVLVTNTNGWATSACRRTTFIMYGYNSLNCGNMLGLWKD